jgi:hypothetical protein
MCCVDWDAATHLLSRETSLRALQLILSSHQQQSQVDEKVAAATTTAATMTRHGEAVVPQLWRLSAQPQDNRIRAELQLMTQAHRLSMLEQSAMGLWTTNNRLPMSHQLYHQLHQEEQLEHQVKSLLAMQANRQLQQHQLLAEQQQQQELNAAVMLQCLQTAAVVPPRSSDHEGGGGATARMSLPPPREQRLQQGPAPAAAAAAAPLQPERRLCSLLASEPPPPSSSSSMSSSSSSSSTTMLNDKNIPLCLPVSLDMATDAGKLSPLQALLRNQILVFEASADDVTGHVRGRNKAIRVGQVGIQCRHCAYLPIPLRHKGFAYFPTSVWGYYQASQNMLATHMHPGGCSVMSRAIKQEFATWQTKSKQLGSSHAKPSGAGRAYWAKSAESLGLVDMEGGVYFVRHLPTDLGPPQPTASHVYRTTTKKRARDSD